MVGDVPGGVVCAVFVTGFDDTGVELSPGAATQFRAGGRVGDRRAV